MGTTTDSDVSIEQPISFRNSCHSIRLLLALPPRTWLKMSKFTSFLRLCTLLRMTDLLLFSSSFSTWEPSQENRIHTLNNNTKLSCILTHPPRAPFSSLYLSCSTPTPHPPTHLSQLYASIYIQQAIHRLFFIYFFLLSAVTFRPSVFAVRCIPCRGRMGSWWLRSPVASNTILRPGLPLDGWLGWPDPINRLVVLCPNF